MRRYGRAKIILAWHTPASPRAIAMRFATSAGEVLEIWRAAQTRGELPPDPRPFFAAASAPPVVAAPAPPVVPTPPDDPIALAIDCEIEASELLAEQSGLRIPAADPLLARLKAVHGRDRRRRFVLRQPDDRGQERPRAMRSPADARALARRWDSSLRDFARRAVNEVVVNP